MPRIPLPTPETMTAEQRRVYDAIVSGPRGTLVGPLRAALHNPELADKWQQLGALLRYRTSLPAEMSEVAILVTARRWSCQVEWHMHSIAAAQAGITADVIESIKQNRRPDGANARQLAIHDFAVELTARGTVSQDRYDPVRSAWGEVGVVELTALIGYYTMVAMTLNAHQIPLPAGVAPPLPEIAA
ncbi:MAG TPA: carboxymuconolactone decarboxylase family protein [Xanthobacteraceae bacterium]|nr:carboxymuconolactone decarboxylase family protein [Xanthobacteraceae bacterium]